MFCRQCGKQLNDGAAFCNGCGAQMKAPGDAPQASPDAAATTPMPQVPAAFPAPAQASVAPKRSRTGLIVTLAVVGVLVVGAGVLAGLYFSGALGKSGLVASRTDVGSSKSPKRLTPVSKDATSTGGSTGATDDTTALSASASFELLLTHYDRLSSLGDQVGRAYEDKYGGTGFAYDVFNGSIGSADLGVREGLVTKCQGMLDTVSGAKQTLDEAKVSSAYESQKGALLGLYGLLEKRVQAMLGAAEAAVGDPDESAWRPILSPISTETREQFESDYPGAAPEKL